MADTKSFDLISLGECLVEFSRMPIGSFHAAYAGDAFNTLFYASRLGLRTGFISTLGNDLFTQMLEEDIKREGIDTTHLLKIADRNNGLYFIDLDEEGEYTFHFWRENSAARETLARQNIDDLVEYASRSYLFLITGVTLSILHEPNRLVTLLSRLRGKTRIVFDTNYRSSLWPSPKEYQNSVRKITPYIDIFLPSRHDLSAAFPDQDLNEVLAEFAENGTTVIAVKAGGDGCLLYHDRVLKQFPAIVEEHLVDTTGAGDAFNAGFLAGLLRNESSEECCHLGQETASHALHVHGAIAHSFRRDQVHGSE